MSTFEAAYDDATNPVGACGSLTLKFKDKDISVVWVLGLDPTSDKKFRYNYTSSSMFCSTEEHRELLDFLEDRMTKEGLGITRKIDALVGPSF